MWSRFHKSIVKLLNKNVKLIYVFLNILHILIFNNLWDTLNDFIVETQNIIIQILCLNAQVKSYLSNLIEK